jgi:thiamine biosynthesis lipoprotein
MTREPTDLSRGQDRSLPSRRQFIALGLGAFVVGSLPLAVTRRRERTIRRTLPVMGTIADFAVVHADPRYGHAAIDAAMAELQRVERTMTRFAATSDVGRANLAAARGPVAVSPETAHVVARALAWAEASDGSFDPAIGGAVELWDVNHRHAPPPERDVRPLAGRRLFAHVEVGRDGGDSLLRYHDADVRLDLGAIGKGFAVDRAVAVLREWGIAAAIVNVGGDLYALGAAPDGEAWRIGIRDPGDAGATLGTVLLEDAAIATSGTYAQFFRSGGHLYHHLLDPATAAPRETPVRSLTVQAARCIDADAAATALYGMTTAGAERVLARVAPDARVVRAG